MQNFIPVLIGYLAGAIPFGLILGKLSGIDVRQSGSGNIGATNVLRTCGAKWGIPALLLDMLKGLLPVWAVWQAKLFDIADENLVMVSALTALACILGHTFPIYLKFKGGKGVATSAGVFLALMPAAVGIAFLSFFIAVALTRYISVGSTLAAVVIVVCQHVMVADTYSGQLPITVLVWLVLVLVIVRHRGNYARLLKGTENKFGKKAEQPADFTEGGGQCSDSENA